VWVSFVQTEHVIRTELLHSKLKQRVDILEVLPVVITCIDVLPCDGTINT